MKDCARDLQTAYPRRVGDGAVVHECRLQFERGDVITIRNGTMNLKTALRAEDNFAQEFAGFVTIPQRKPCSQVVPGMAALMPPKQLATSAL